MIAHTLGWLGTGRMGAAMAARLLKAGHPVTVWNRTALAEKAGVPRAAFLDFLNSTVLGSDWVRKRTPDLLALDWTPTFATELLRKDFDLGLAAARQHEVTMPLAGNVFQLLQAAIGRGYRDADFLSLFAVEAASSGMDVQPSQ